MIFGEKAALFKTKPISSQIADTLLEKRFSSIGSIPSMTLRVSNQSCLSNYSLLIDTLSLNGYHPDEVMGGESYPFSFLGGNLLFQSKISCANSVRHGFCKL